MVTYGFALTWDHCKRLDCSLHLSVIPFPLMVPLAEEKSDLATPIKPFQPMANTNLITDQIIIG